MLLRTANRMAKVRAYTAVILTISNSADITKWNYSDFQRLINAQQF